MNSPPAARVPLVFSLVLGGLLLTGFLLNGGLLQSAAQDESAAAGDTAATGDGQPADDGKPAALKILFLGSGGHHVPAERFAQIKPVLEKRGIDVTYTDKMADINAENLARYDGLLIYANIDRIEPAQEKALLDYVNNGKGLIPIHCASFCFRNSDDYVAAVGAQFKRHGTGTFRTQIAEAKHPVMQGFGGFESWDETYEHDLHNERGRTVLEYRVAAGQREPWTWVRKQGKGRVFYTAWGHDERTWGNPGFENLLERGIRWATGGDPSLAGPYLEQQAFPVPAMNPDRKDVKPFEYVDAPDNIPNYLPGRRWGVQGEAITKMQAPLAPEESLKHLVVPQGFHVELFAAEPDLGGKPITMNWDERGRLWVCETVDYPNDLQPPGGGRDRIRICEDTDGDGRADKFTVFAEKLSIPTAIAFSRGGAIVQNGTQTIFLRDTDGDDRADEREVLLAGWALGDTHGGVSNFRYGLDNWIWAMQGYNNSRVRAGGETVSFRMGFFRFRPDGSKLEFLRSTNNNTWGLGISEEGIVFGSTANHNPSVYMPIANRYYEAVRGWSPAVLDTIAESHLFHPITDKVRQVDQFGGYTAGAGHALYTARAYPQEYWNRTAFVCGPTGHLVGTFVIDAEGADFHSANRFNLLASDDEWTAPIMAEVGPDGCVWVSDWYNYIVQHNPTPAGFKTGRGNAYETKLRDKTHGRIYRVVYDAAKREQPVSLAGASPEVLVKTLAHPTLLWRRHAQRLLVERGKQDVVPQLVAMVNDRSVDEIGLNVGAIHALWTLQGLGAIGTKGHRDAIAAAVGALGHPSGGVRRNALQVLPPEKDSVTAILERELLEDRSPQVRLAALLALADMPADERVGPVIARLLNDAGLARDKWLADAATSAAAKNDVSFIAALAEIEKPSDTLLERTAIVAEHFARGGSADSIPAVLAALGKAPEPAAGAMIGGMARGWPRNVQVKLDDDAQAALEKLFERLPASSQGQLVRLASTWGSDRLEQYAAKIGESLLATVKDESAREAQRIEAARSLVAFQANNAQVVGKLLATISPRTSPALAAGILEAAAGSNARESGKQIVDAIAGLTPASRAVGIRVLLGRAEWTAALLDAVEKNRLAFSDLALDQRQQLAAHPDRRIARRARALLEAGGGLPNPDRAKVIEELAGLADVKGDVTLGQAVYKKHCSKCHVHGNEGTRIGPDLTGMAVHPKHELLVHILDPSRSVEGNFRVYTVVTEDGRVINGLLASESRTAVELFDAEGKRITLSRDDIDELVASPKSLMPEGFEKQVSREELTNLLEFLTARGRYLPLDLRKVATITSVRGMFFGEQGRTERLIFSDWTPKTFNDVPFQLVDPQDGRVPNVVLLYGPQGTTAPKMPRSVELPVGGPAKAIHLLSGISGWGYPLGEKNSVTMIVRLHYADGATEDRKLLNGVHFADYIRRVDVPESELAFMLRGRQLRYLAVHPERDAAIDKLELVKGDDSTAPIVMAVTLESRE